MVNFNIYTGCAEKMSSIDCKLPNLNFLALAIVIQLAIFQADIIARPNGYFEWNITGLQLDDGNSFLGGEERLTSSALIYVKQELESEQAKFVGEVRLLQGLQNSPDLKFIFDEFYSSLFLPHDIYISGGQRRYSYSYSYFWSPTFLSNPQRDIYEPERNSEGIPMLVAGYSGTVFSPKILLTTGDSKKVPFIGLNDLKFGIHSDIYVRSTEAYLCGIYSDTHEKLVGGGVRRLLFNNTMHAEGCYYENRDIIRVEQSSKAISNALVIVYKKDAGYTISAGLNRSMFGGGLLTFEFFHDEGGMTSSEFDTFYDALYPNALPDSSSISLYNSIRPILLRNIRPGYMQEDNLFLSYMHRIGSTWLFGIRSLFSLNDSSGYVYPIVSFSPATSIQIVTECLFPFYKEKSSEFGLLNTSMLAQLRLRYYF